MFIMIMSSSFMRQPNIDCQKRQQFTLKLFHWILSTKNKVQSVHFHICLSLTTIHKLNLQINFYSSDILISRKTTKKWTFTFIVLLADKRATTTVHKFRMLVSYLAISEMYEKVNITKKSRLGVLYSQSWA